MMLQSHKGSSETTAKRRAVPITGRFNPTRVLLKRRFALGFCAARTSFNPTRVLLKHANHIVEDVGRERFNPTRVLLKHLADRLAERGVPVLQSHKGSSETDNDGWIVSMDKALQSHKGSSETVCILPLRLGDAASIPQGFF